MLPTFFFFTALLFAASSHAQQAAHLDSLENAIKHAESTLKADLMIGAISYQTTRPRSLSGEKQRDLSTEAYRYSKSINYAE